MTAKQIVELNAFAFTQVGMNDRGLSVVPIEDDRMEPTLRRGDCVLVDPTVTRFKGEGLYVLDQNGYPAVYRADALTTRGIRMILDNPLYGSPYYVTPADFDKGVLGKVIAIGRVVDHAAMERLAGGAS